MKAVLLTGFGGPDVLRFGDVADPVAGAGEVVIDIYAVSVNAADYKARLGTYSYTEMKFPHILGRDFSGVVSAIGNGADFKVGDEVFGVALPERDGAYAEKIAIDASIVAKKPAELTHADAAAMALTGLTAISALVDKGKLRPGETILIHGGAGGVGGFAIPLAKHLGATVITTASASNHAYVEQLGADRVIDYNASDFTKVVEKCDAVLDTVGGEVQSKSYEVLRPGGRLIWVAPGIDGYRPSRNDVSVLNPKVERSRSQLERIVQLWSTGAVLPPELTHFPLAETAEAHRISEGRHFRGKLVLDVR